MMSRALENARAALNQLEAFLGAPVVTDRDRAGVIQAFEFTFEAVWKLFRAIAVAEGLPAESPKRSLAAAFRLGLLADESLWLEMLQDRNLTSHIYHLEIAARIFESIRDRYARALSDAVGRAESGSN